MLKMSRTGAEVLRQMNSQPLLDQTVETTKTGYPGHIMRRHKSTNKFSYTRIYSNERYMESEVKAEKINTTASLTRDDMKRGGRIKMCGKLS